MCSLATNNQLPQTIVYSTAETIFIAALTGKTDEECDGSTKIKLAEYTCTLTLARTRSPQPASPPKVLVRGRRDITVVGARATLDDKQLFWKSNFSDLEHLFSQ